MFSTSFFKLSYVTVVIVLIDCTSNMHIIFVCSANNYRMCLLC